MAFLLGCGIEGEPGDLEPQGPQAQALTLASCTQESDCTSGLACVAGACRPCSAHAQCQSDVCDQGAATSLGPGACVPEASVVYVKAGPYPGCDLGDGSRADPVCEIRPAIARAVGAKYAVRVYPGFYLPFGVTGRTVYVFGPGDGSAFVGKEDLSVGARVSAGATAVLDGLDFDVAVRTGLICADSRLKVLRGSARGDYNALSATNCDLELDRMKIHSGLRSGLTITGGTYRITNSYFIGEYYPAVVFDGPSTGTFRFNTVQGGGYLSPGGLDCGTTPRTIADSIVIGATPAADGAQTIGACTHRRVVVGGGDTRALPGLIHIDPDLDPEGRLLDTPADHACCIDRGARYVPSLYRDFFGTPRPQGPSNDIGAHEL